MRSVQTAVLGDPLAYTLSPVLHRAGCEALGISCEASAVRTPPDRLGETLRELAARGLVGCNLTHPLKEHALDHVEKASLSAERARSVNTIVFREDGWWGETTDGPGFLDLLKAKHFDPARQRVVLLPGGGAAPLPRRAGGLVEVGDEPQRHRADLDELARRHREEEHIAGRTHAGDGGRAQARDEIQVDQEIERLDDQPDPDERRHRQEMARDRAFGEVAHCLRSVNGSPL